MSSTDPRNEFACKVCGIACAIAPADGSGAVCEEHCPDHQYDWAGSEGFRCVHCFRLPPEDHFDE